MGWSGLHAPKPGFGWSMENHTRPKPYQHITKPVPNRTRSGWVPLKSNPLPSLDGEKGKLVFFFFFFLIVKVMVHLQREQKVDRSPSGHHLKLNEAWVWFKGPRPNGSNFFNILEDGNGYPVAKRA